MRIKLSKLIKNELIKIFKRKSLYVLFFLSFVVILFYQMINPDQNQQIKGYDTFDKNIDLLEISLEGIKQVSDVTITKVEPSTDESSDLQNYLHELNEANTAKEQYKELKTEIDFAYLYNQYPQNSWQRYALNEETRTIVVGENGVDFSHLVEKQLAIINDYELANTSTTSLAEYQSAKMKYTQYKEALSMNDSQKFVELKINDLKQRKEDINLTEVQQKLMDIQIDTYQLRLTNQIEYTNDFLNQYLQEYEEKSCFLLNYETQEREDALYKQEIAMSKAEIALTKYAVEHKINQDISPVEFNLTINNKIDARNSLVRTFQHFDLIIVIVAIYLSCTIVTEEVNKGTIKNLVTKPHKRSTILFAKMMACLITIVVTMVFVSISQFMIGGLVFGFESYSLDFIGYDYTSGQVFTMNLMNYLLIVGLAKLPMYLFLIVFCMWIGISNNHISMSMIISLLLFLIFSTIITEWSKNEQFSLIARYFITNNWDFSVYLFGQGSNIDGLTMTVSMFIYVTYLIAFGGIGIYQFNHKEINNVS